jgi:tol-pal system protein YbgF
MVVSSGCSNSKEALTKTIDDLNRELLRARASKLNLTARNVSLDDRVLLLEKQIEKCRSDEDEKRLRVVTLTTGSKAEFEPPVAEEIIWKDQEIPPPDNGKKRPVLTIVGERRASAGAGAGASYSSGGPVVPSLIIGGDNLGVVDTDGGGSSAPGPMDDFHKAYRAYSNKDFTVALEVFSRFIREHPGHKYADNAMYWRGECFFSQGKMLKAIGEYERLLRRYPRSEKTASTLYRIGFIYDKLHDHQRAGEYYFKVVEMYPGTPAARKASLRVAAIRERKGASMGLLPTSVKR